MYTVYEIEEDDEEYYGKERIMSNDGHEMVTEIVEGNGDIILKRYSRVAMWQLESVKRFR